MDPEAGVLRDDWLTPMEFSQETAAVPIPSTERTYKISLGGEYAAIVDETDYFKYKDIHWFPLTSRSGHTYATAYFNGRRTHLHRLVATGNPLDLVDHIDGDTMNCRRSNLRRCTRAENSRNTAKTGSETSSRFKGVSRFRDRWRAQICFEGANRSLGIFNDELDAARAYDQRASALFGQYARLNLPDNTPRGA